MRGIVKVFYRDNGYGFISSDETQSDVFFHQSIVEEDLEKGDSVEFECENTNRGLKATTVSKL